jgi:DNA-binding NtrC family response regulator
VLTDMRTIADRLHRRRSRGRVLVVAHPSRLARSIGAALARERYEVSDAQPGLELIETVTTEGGAPAFDIAVLHLWPGDEVGLAALEAVRTVAPALAVVVAAEDEDWEAERIAPHATRVVMRQPLYVTAICAATLDVTREARRVLGRSQVRKRAAARVAGDASWRHAACRHAACRHAAS